MIIIALLLVHSVSDIKGLTYDDDPLKIDGPPLWERLHTSSRSFTTPTTSTNLNSPLDADNEYGEFSSHNALKDFLDNYAETLRKEKLGNTLGDDTDSKLNEKKGQKSWNLLNLQHHKHPFEDKKGWVTLDPIPWSVSKISKWKPKATEKPVQTYYPNQNVWDEDVADTNDEYIYKKPQADIDRFQVQYINAEKPIYSKPFASTHPLIQTNYHKTPIQISNYHNKEENCNHQEIDGIITDGQLPNFPTRSSENRRSSTEMQPYVHPFLGEGDWVLLSTTRGYKAPKRGQRSLDLNPDSIGTRKGVKLTVLPPLKNSKVNMTTSHGGILQVESTFETVDQAQKKFQKTLLKGKKRKRPHKTAKRRKQIITSPSIATIPKNTDSSAVLAGVGAGMIPATMAMLVPIALNGKKRRKRHTFTTSDPSSIEITLQRYL